MSAPTTPTTPPVAPGRPTLDRLKMGVQSILEEVDFDNEELAALKSSKEGAAKSRLVVHPKEEARVRVQVDIVKVREEKESVATREPDLKKELKRGSMKEKWGLTLVHRVDKSRICLSAKKVSMFSAAAKAGIAVGDTLVTINDWNIEAMDNIQA